MVIKRIKANKCGAKVDLKLLQEGSKAVEDKSPPNRGKGRKTK